MNLLDYSEWAVGTNVDALTGFTPVGPVSGNALITTTDPFGVTGVTVWSGYGFSITPLQGNTASEYRMSVWVRRTANGGGYRFNMDGSNTQGFYKATHNYPGELDQWRLHVFHLHVNGYMLPNSKYTGVYAPGHRFRIRQSEFTDGTFPTVADGTINLHISTTTTTDYAYPRIDLLDGSEPTVWSLLESELGERVPLPITDGNEQFSNDANPTIHLARGLFFRDTLAITASTFVDTTIRPLTYGLDYLLSPIYYTLSAKYRREINSYIIMLDRAKFQRIYVTYEHVDGQDTVLQDEMITHFTTHDDKSISDWLLLLGEGTIRRPVSVGKEFISLDPAPALEQQIDNINDRVNGLEFVITETHDASLVGRLRRMESEAFTADITVVSNDYATEGRLGVLRFADTATAMGQEDSELVLHPAGARAVMLDTLSRLASNNAKWYDIVRPTITNGDVSGYLSTVPLYSTPYAATELFTGTLDYIEWQVSANYDFSTLLTGIINGLGYTVTSPMPAGSYFARVRHASDGHLSTWSGVVTLTVN